MDAPSSVNPNHPKVQQVDQMSLSPPTSFPSPPSVSVFNNSNNARVKNSTFNITTHSYNTYNLCPTSSPLDLLYKAVAPNAILNSGGRADEVRCHPGTRDEVLGLVEKSIAQEDDGPRMLWLSGPAGAGKSAIMQTVAERCEERGVPHANFFFFRADSSRADASAFVATLTHQIIKKYPSVAPAVAAALASDPLLLQMSLQQQFDALLHKAFATTQSSTTALPAPPLVLLIDGLDECDSESKAAQRQILLALDALLVQKGSYFRVVIASRVEAQIAMVFKQINSQVDTIFLDEQYLPEKDIHTFVTAEFKNIKTTHYLADTLRSDWPSDADIDGIVSKSSGQFIFAATVMRFIAQSPASPTLSLKKVQRIVPPAKNTPFAHLDAVYTYILGQVDDLEAVKTILATNFVAHLSRSLHKAVVLTYDERFSEEVFDSCISELSSLVDGRAYLLQFYHASFPDFLKDKARAGDFHIDVEAFCMAAVPIWWAFESRLPEDMCHSAFNAIFICTEALKQVHRPTPVITAALMKSQPYLSRIARDKGGLNRDLNRLTAFVKELHRIYTPHDRQEFTSMMRMWRRSGIDLTPLLRHMGLNVEQSNATPSNDSQDCLRICGRGRRRR